LAGARSGHAAPTTPLDRCEPEEWFTHGQLPTGCGPNDPVVSVALTTRPGSPRCAPKTCTSRAPLSGGLQQGGTYACRSAAVAHRCPGIPTVGAVTPKYYVAAIVYSPPGCTDTPGFRCAQTSTVTYGSGSSVGAQTSTQSSFRGGVKVDASVTVGNAATGSLSASASLAFEGSQASGSSMAIAKRQNREIRASGNQDGINHDQDQFILILSPVVSFSSVDDTVQWSMGSSSATAQYVVSVANLKNPASNPARMKTLEDLGFTTADYQTILALNPFANGGTTVDPNRFVPTTWNAVPYETPDTGTECNGGTCSCLAMTNTIANELDSTATTSGQTQYSVGLSLSGQTPGVWPVSAQASVAGSLTWTSSQTSMSSTGSSQTAAVTIQCPSPGYAGPQALDVYWDTIFGTFMFAPHDFKGGARRVEKPTRGRVATDSGAPARHERVDLVYAGKTYHTYTNKQGDYAFETVPAGAGQTTVKTPKLTVTPGALPLPRRIVR
jgi:hypothetical protein